MPPIDPDNEQFVIYVRSKKRLQVLVPPQCRDRRINSQHTCEGSRERRFKRSSHKVVDKQYRASHLQKT